jgi:hypothetical protein
MSQLPDPMQDAMKEDPKTPKSYYCEISAQADYVTIAKGRQAQPWDPAVDKPETRQLQVTVLARPIGEMNIETDKLPRVLREGLRDLKWGESWKITRKSLEDLHFDLASVNGKFAEVQTVANGRKYTSKTNGNQYDELTLKFIKVFASEDDCVAAYRKATIADAPPAAAPTPAPDNGREVALKFLKVMVPMWCKDGLDPDKVRNGLAANPVLAKYFTPDSEEVVTLMMATVKA